MNSSFLTNAVESARDQARVSYLDILTRKQKRGGKKRLKVSLEVSRDQHQTNLDQYWEQATQAAFAGDVSSASTQLNSLVMEWGLYKAHQDLIDACGTYLDPADPDTANDFVRAVKAKVVFWATELINIWNEGERQRKADLEHLYAQRNEHLFGVQNHIIQNQSQALDQAHQYNVQYADAAQRSAQQAQQSVQWMMQHADSIYGHVQQSLRENLNAQRAATVTTVQNFPREMERAQVRMQWHSLLTRGCMVVLLMLACPAMFVLAYLILTLVVLRH